MRQQIGAWGKTLFALKEKRQLELRQQHGVLVLSVAEICAIAAYAQVLDLDYAPYVLVMKKRLDPFIALPSW